MARLDRRAFNPVAIPICSVTVNKRPSTLTRASIGQELTSMH